MCGPGRREPAVSRAVLLDASPGGRTLGAGTVVTLSARAEHDASVSGLEHVTLSDIANEAALAAVEPGYWDQQTAWFELVERRIAELSPVLRDSGLRPLIASGYMLKALIDPVFVRAFESDALTRQGWGEIDHHVRLGGPELLAQVLRQFCGERGIAYRLTGEGHPEVGATGDSTPPLARLGRALRFEYVLRRPPRSHLDQDALEGLDLLLLSSYYDLADLLARNRSGGGRTALVEGRAVLELGRLRRRTVARFKPASARDARDWLEIAEAIRRDEDLRRWPESWFDGLAADIVMDRLALWLQGTMPEILAYASGFSALFAAERFDAVVAPYVAHPVEVGAFAAAGVSGNPKSVLIEHGDTAHLAPSWDFELRASDVVFAPTDELATYFRGRVHLYPGTAAEAEVGSYRWRQSAELPARRPRPPVWSLLRGQSPARSSPIAFDRSKPVLVYLVTLIAGDRRYLNNAWYPDAWYFGLQRAIVDTLARHTQFNVIVKHFPGVTLDDGAIAEHVAKLSLPHVMTSTAPFSRWLPWTDRVVADIASTGLYEALIAGRPSVGLLWKNHVARPGAITALGPALVPFETIADAAAAVDRFASSSSPAMPDLRPEGADILKTLGRVVPRNASV